MKKEKNIRLRQLRKESGKSCADFAEFFGIAEPTQRSYENGSRYIPIEYALKVCNKYHVTLDWIYGRSKNRNEADAIISSVLLAFDKVFRIGSKTVEFSDCVRRMPALFVDRTFTNYLIDIDKLRMQYNILGDKIFVEAYTTLQEKYKDLLLKLFGDMEYDGNNDRFIEVCSLRIIDIINLLSFGEWDN